jgi:hypothetical protein
MDSTRQLIDELHRKAATALNSDMDSDLCDKTAGSDMLQNAFNAYADI